ncbi:hypothetical protein MDX29_005397, partial [Klebsiella pneumoniae]
ELLISVDACVSTGRMLRLNIAAIMNFLIRLSRSYFVVINKKYKVNISVMQLFFSDNYKT